MIKAAGILFVAPGQKALFLKRGPGDWAGAWCLPGGKIEDGEAALDAAKREAFEETGFKAKEPALWTRRIATDGPIPPPVTTPDHINPPPGLLSDIAPATEEVDFTTFVQPVAKEFDVKLDGESVGWAWAPIDAPPEPLHPGCRIALARFGLDELGIARAMAEGELTSPQRYANVTLFAIRITGTGASYRAGIDEYVWRDSSIYLNDEFLARCNGLPVIWVHPDSAMLTSEEFGKRVIGTTFLPFIKADEVWAIVKIYDAYAAEMMETKQLSTSPAVNFDKRSGNETVTLEGGSKFLIEGKPALLDHIAVLDGLGVWDKGGPRAGVESTDVRADARAAPPSAWEAPGMSSMLDNAVALTRAMVR